MTNFYSIKFQIFFSSFMYGWIHPHNWFPIILKLELHKCTKQSNSLSNKDVIYEIKISIYKTLSYSVANVMMNKTYCIDLWNICHTEHVIKYVK
jgi:hypothetical protein